MGSLCTSPQLPGLFRGSGVRGLGFRGLGFRGLGFRGLGVSGFGCEVVYGVRGVGVWS